ncbi:hypothetical protein BDV95DRAFT_597458 [Massariosphaeria phaeospora]|uniref:F-box domain-containing protein n=1 Tax=Massariosphaeria phaeospora TaxID=100035 RepID=A0A7C8I621_9PLEO|nr:hypothetical protein BDV95DRAFT_597458 [Massariosphaeria phaeospora]
MTNLNSLATEVQLQIAGYLPPRSLLALARTSKKWNAPAEEALYRAPKIQKHDLNRRLMCLLKALFHQRERIQKMRGLSLLLRNLCIPVAKPSQTWEHVAIRTELLERLKATGVSNQAWFDRIMSWDLMAWYGALITILPNLKALHIEYLAGPDYWIESGMDFRHNNCPSRRLFHLQFIGGGTNDQIPGLQNLKYLTYPVGQLLSPWLALSKLETLELGIRSNFMGDTSHPPLSPVMSGVTRLIMKCDLRILLRGHYRSENLKQLISKLPSIKHIELSLGDDSENDSGSTDPYERAELWATEWSRHHSS